MMRIVAVFAAQDNRSWKSRMSKFAVGTFASGHDDKPRLLQIGHELTDFAGHPAGLIAPAGM
jgi:hypothetical protein